jgi:lipid A ethanolaminephosphotransferase
VNSSSLVKPPGSGRSNLPTLDAAAGSGFANVRGALRSLPVWVTLCLLSLWFTAVQNAPVYGEVARVAGPPAADNLAIYLGLTVLLLAVYNLTLGLLAWPWVFKPAVTLLLVAGAIVAYFMGHYGVVVDRVMIQNVLETDAREAAELLSPRFFASVLLLGLAPAAVVWRLRPWRHPILREIRRRLVFLVVNLVVLGTVVTSLYGDLAPFYRNNRQLRHYLNPLYPVYAAVTHIRRSPLELDGAPQPIAREVGRAHQAERRSVTVLVLGETARADHFGLNGYQRQTTPRLASLDVVNFPDVTSCGTSTAVSVPCIFSPLGRDRFDERVARRSEGLLDLLRRAGLRVLWRENNTGCKGVCDRVEVEDFRRARAPEQCPGGECLDSVLLTGLQEQIDRTEGDLVIVLHLIGSHGPAYFQRYAPSAEVFGPVCATAELQKCSRQQVINTYDNTIVYTDAVLAELIGLLGRNAQQRDAAMIYVSDHGESLGENGVYLHGIPYAFAPDAQTRVPMVMWLSEGYRRTAGVDLECLQTRAGASYSHDNIFHSVLGILGIATDAYVPSLDIFSACRSPEPRDLRLTGSSPSPSLANLGS